MELFEYYDLYSLYYSILPNCQVHVDFDRVQSIDFLAHTLPKINPKNIRSLYDSKSDQISILAYDKSLIYFTYIPH